MSAELPPPVTMLHEYRACTLIDELLPGQGAHLEHGVIDFEVVTVILKGIGAVDAAAHFQTVAERIVYERCEESWRAREEDLARFEAERRAERAWARRMPCPRCGAPAGRVCKLPSGTRLDDSHKDRRNAAGPTNYEVGPQRSG